MLLHRWLRLIYFFIDIWMIFLLTFGWYFYWHLDIFIDIWIFLLIFGWYLFVILMISFLNILMFLLIFVYFYWDLDDICLIFIGKLLSRCTAARDLHPLHWREALLLYSIIWERPRVNWTIIVLHHICQIFARFQKKIHPIFARTFF